MHSSVAMTVLSVLFLISSCTGVTRTDGPYEGRVVDADTGAPIEGVVVLGVWYKEYPTVAGSSSKFYDAVETVTDSNGEFKIKGLGHLFRSNIAPIHLVVFKTGYEYESGYWDGLKRYSKKIQWEGEKAIMPLKKLSLDERKQQGQPLLPFGNVGPGKIRLMLREIDKERVALGFEPLERDR